MSKSINSVQLLGHLGADPEARSFSNGGKVVSLRIATSESWKDTNTGEDRERTEWHSVSILHEGFARVAEQYLKKGSQVLVEGKLQTRKWQDANGNDRYSTEVVLAGNKCDLIMLGGKPGGSQTPPGQGYDGDDEIPY